MAAAISIYLGSMFARIGLFRQSKFELISDENGETKIPLCVAFTDREILVGCAARNHELIDPVNTIYEIKSLIGREFNDPVIQDGIKRWSFIVKKFDGNVKIQVTHKGEIKQFFPEEILSIILKKLKETVEAYLGETVIDAIITVPTYFNDRQRHSVLCSSSGANLRIMQLLNESTAALIGFGFDNITRSSNVLIYHLGGTSFDLCVGKIEKDSIQVLATAGNSHFGGIHFNQNMLKNVMEIVSKPSCINLVSNIIDVCRLRNACNNAVKKLSSSIDVIIEVNELHDIDYFNTIVYRDSFEKMNANQFEYTITEIKKVLDDAQLNKSSIDDIVLVGGCTEIPKVRELLQQFFNKKQLNLTTIDPNQAIVYGASIKAAILKGHELNSVGKKNVDIIDVTPLSIGFEAFGGITNVIIERNTIIPVQESYYFKINSITKHTIMKIKVAQGECCVMKNNIFLGEFNLIMHNNLYDKIEETVEIEIQFKMNHNGIFEIDCSTAPYANIFEIIPTQKIMKICEICDVFYCGCTHFAHQNRESISN